MSNMIIIAASNVLKTKHYYGSHISSLPHFQITPNIMENSVCRRRKKDGHEKKFWVNSLTIKFQTRLSIKSQTRIEAN